MIAVPAEVAVQPSSLDWYLHDHLGHAPGSTAGIPYWTDLFLYRAAAS